MKNKYYGVIWASLFFSMLVFPCVSFSVDYIFEPIAGVDEGWSPAINDAGEIVYEKYDNNGNPNIFSTARGWLTFSTSGNLRFPDINNQGEVVYADLASPQGGPLTIFSTVRGIIDIGNLPSISNNGEIVYEAGSLPPSVESTTRGVLISAPDVTPWNFEPEVNNSGEVVYISEDSSGNAQVFSTTRGQVTLFPSDRGVGTPSINDKGEVIYCATDGNGLTQVYSTVHGQITDANSFPEPVFPGQFTGTEKFGMYSAGVGYFPDINGKGEIVLAQTLIEGPYWDDTWKMWYGLSYNRLWRATPPIQVSIDIKPGDGPNSINPKSKGKIPVAILSTKDFYAPSQVDPTSLTFGRTGDELSRAFCSGFQDVNRDGMQDLVCHFDNQETGFLCGDTKGILKGKTTAGMPLEGSDSVRINPCK